MVVKGDLMQDSTTIPQLAKQLNVTVQALHQRIKRGTLNAEKVNGNWQVSQPEVQRLVNSFKEVDNELENELKVIRRECDLLREQNEYLKKRIDWLETQTERTTILLAAEQQGRLKRLPSPLNWIRRRVRHHTTTSPNQTSR